MTISTTTRIKSADAYRTISEVAETLKLPQHVLRFWETRFVQIKPLKRAGGRRYYRPEDVELLSAIRHLLYGEGYTIKGVQRILREHGPRAVSTLARGRTAPDNAALPIPLRAATDRNVMAEADDDGIAGSAIEAVAAQHATATVSGAGSVSDPTLAFLYAAPTPDGGGSDDPLAQLRAVLSDLADCRRVLDAARGQDALPAG